MSRWDDWDLLVEQRNNQSVTVLARVHGFKVRVTQSETGEFSMTMIEFPQDTHDGKAACTRLTDEIKDLRDALISIQWKGLLNVLEASRHTDSTNRRQDEI